MQSDAYKPPILGPAKSVAWDSDAIECQTHEPGESRSRDLHHRIRCRQTSRKKPRHDERDSNVSAKPGRKPHRDICTKRAASRPNRGLPVLMRPKQLRAKDLRAFAIVPIRAIKDPRITPKRSGFSLPSVATATASDAPSSAMNASDKTSAASEQQSDTTSGSSETTATWFIADHSTKARDPPATASSSILTSNTKTHCAPG